MDPKHHFNFEIVSLYESGHVPPLVTKVGILPFLPAKPMEVLVMKPRAEARRLGPPAFQIAKGTRRINVNGDWCDMRDDDLRHADESFFESLVATALREGMEEVGLQPENVVKLYDLGGFTFTSASRNIAKPLHMFAAEVKDKKAFISFEATTAMTRWVTREEFAQEGRPDHVKIMDKIMVRLESV